MAYRLHFAGFWKPGDDSFKPLEGKEFHRAGGWSCVSLRHEEELPEDALSNTGVPYMVCTIGMCDEIPWSMELGNGTQKIAVPFWDECSLPILEELFEENPDNFAQEAFDPSIEVSHELDFEDMIALYREKQKQLLRDTLALWIPTLETPALAAALEPEVPEFEDVLGALGLSALFDGSVHL